MTVNSQIKSSPEELSDKLILDNYGRHKAFVRSGSVDRDDGSARRLGFRGYYWSSTASPVFHDGSAGLAVYGLDFNASGVNPSYDPDARWYGFPIRCPRS